MVIKVIIYLILTVSGLMFFKLGSTSNNLQFTLNRIDINLSTISLLGIMCYGMSFLLWLNIIKNNELSYIFPIANGLVTVITVFVGVLILNEHIQIMQLIGIACIIIGVFIVNMYK